MLYDVYVLLVPSWLMKLPFFDLKRERERGWIPFNFWISSNYELIELFTNLIVINQFMEREREREQIKRQKETAYTNIQYGSVHRTFFFFNPFRIQYLNPCLLIWQVTVKAKYLTVPTLTCCSLISLFHPSPPFSFYPLSLSLNSSQSLSLPDFSPSKNPPFISPPPFLLPFLTLH